MVYISSKVRKSFLLCFHTRSLSPFCVLVLDTLHTSRSTVFFPVTFSLSLSLNLFHAAAQQRTPHHYEWRQQTQQPQPPQQGRKGGKKREKKTLNRTSHASGPELSLRPDRPFFPKLPLSLFPPFLSLSLSLLPLFVVCVFFSFVVHINTRRRPGETFFSFPWWSSSNFPRFLFQNNIFPITDVPNEVTSR